MVECDFNCIGPLWLSHAFKSYAKCNSVAAIIARAQLEA